MENSWKVDFVEIKTYQELIDFSQYEAGVYLIKAQSETAIQVEKVVKIR
ncbi:MAG: hypothetical protein ISR55_09160 [Bacteroidetes bacterium]|nr:hypothetical protein [Bacteroidota bacterium]